MTKQQSGADNSMSKLCF